MGIETKEAKEFAPEPDYFEALFGSHRNNQPILPYPAQTQFRVFVGNLNEPNDRQTYETLLTKSFFCQNVLKQPGDLAVLNIQGSFDRLGEYRVVARYAILPETDEPLTKENNEETSNA